MRDEVLALAAELGVPVHGIGLAEGATLFGVELSRLRSAWAEETRAVKATDSAAAKRTPLGVLSDRNPRERILICAGVASLMCGVFGIRSEERDVARLAYFGLFALQHRGQESAGIAVSDGGRLTVVRDMGLVAQVFNEQQLHALPGEVAIGHTRYSTTGANRWANAQPLIHHGRERTVALGHNGNLVNVEELRAELEADGVRLTSGSDSEVIAALIARDRRPLGGGGRERDAQARGRVLGHRRSSRARSSPSAIRSASARLRSGRSARTGWSHPRRARST